MGRQDIGTEGGRGGVSGLLIMILATRLRPARRILASAAILTAFSGYLAPGVCRHVSCREDMSVSPQAATGSLHRPHAASQDPDRTAHEASTRAPAGVTSSERNGGEHALCQVAAGCCMLPTAPTLEGPAAAPLFFVKDRDWSVILRELSSRSQAPLLPPPRA